MNYHAHPPTVLPAESSYVAHGISRACHLSGLPRTKLYDLAAEGRLTLRKAGRKTVVLHGDLERLMAELPTAKIRLKNAK